MSMVVRLSPNLDTNESPSGKITLDVIPFTPSLSSQGPRDNLQSWSPGLIAIGC
jgi:hypothetical protein